MSKIGQYIIELEMDEETYHERTYDLGHRNQQEDGYDMDGRDDWDIYWYCHDTYYATVIDDNGDTIMFDADWTQPYRVRSA